MLTHLVTTLLATLTAAAPASPADTSFVVPEDARLEVQNVDGLIRVSGTSGDRMTVRVVGAPDRAARVERSGSVIRVGLASGDGDPDEYEGAGFEIEVPRATDLLLQGAEEDILVDGVTGRVDAQNSDGGITVTGPARSVRAQSADADVVVEGARGDVDLYSMDSDVRVTDVEGEIRAESLDGDVILRDVRSDRVAGSTTDGDVFFDGEIRSSGTYILDTHDGHVWMVVPEGTSAAFDVFVHDGSMEASFGIPVTGARHAHTHHRFVLGNGSARVELRSFDGNVYLRRPGQLPDRGIPDGNE